MALLDFVRKLWKSCTGLKNIFGQMNPRFPSFPWKYGEREKTWWRQCYGVGLCSYLWDRTYTSDTRLLVLLGHVAADRRTRMIFEVYRTTPSAQFEQNAAKLIGHRFSPSAWWHKSILQKTKGLQVKGTDIHQWPSQSHDLNTTERLLNAKLSAERPTKQAAVEGNCSKSWAEHLKGGNSILWGRWNLGVDFHPGIEKQSL